MALLNRQFGLLWHGQLVSQLGNQAFLIATAIFVADATGSAAQVAAVMMAATIPVVVLGPFGGTVADRHSRRAILVTTDLARAVAVGGLGWVLLRQPEVTERHIAFVIAVSAFGGVMHAMFLPALHAAIPDLVPPDRLAAANSLSQISGQASTLAGQAAGGVLYAAWGIAPLLLFDAVTFAYAAVATWFIPSERREARPAEMLWVAASRYALETREGIDYVRRQPGMMPLMAMFTGVNFLFMPVFVLLPLYVPRVLGGGPEWYGFLLAGFGAGALTGSATTAVVPGLRRSGGRMIRLCVGGIAACMLLLAAATHPWPALVAFVAIGVLSSMINVVVITAFQSAVAAELRGRVMALVVTCTTAAAPLGMALGGVLGDRWPESLPILIASCGAGIAALSALGGRATALR